MNRSFCLACLAVSLFFLPPAFPQQSGPGASGGRHIVTRTRLVSLYSNLETQLATAAEEDDQSAMRQMVADDFNQWTPAPPGDPIPAEDWLAKYRPSSFSLRQVAVQNFGNTDVVNFVLTQKGRFGSSILNGSYFVVDVWNSENGQPRLAARYVSPTLRTSVKVSTPTGKQ